MKRAFLCGLGAAAVLIGFSAAAQLVIPLASAYYVDEQTITISGLSTNGVYGTNFCEANLYHSWQFVCTSNMNGLIVSYQASNNQTNWFQLSTNSFAATATAGAPTTDGYTTHGHYSYFRVSLTGTNVYGVVTYRGGR